ncbi:alpha/beta hydrolase [Stappia sp. ES.058]|uniref:alpha/beta hydrolase n=1 Tax=Stappia sp. ES.058 TaxID=1881061 RepID=UPI00087A476F|nr:alpha/beta hydrolase [Stappia sp. ES.058]SDU15518.1 Lysophospholipase, alpha-beta hydrolase superfamily [Stappia sp. ES.058]
MSWRRHDTATSHFVASTDETDLALHLRAHGDDPARTPVLFVHGATYASRLYDVPHPGASWLKATADAGFAAYALDIRGYGKSHSARMEHTKAPYARASAARRDIDDAVNWILARHDRLQLHLVGGSWGSITTASYAAGTGADRVERLVLYAPIFAEKNDAWLSLLADPADASRLNPAFGACRLVTEADTRARWDAEMPEGADWRDEDVFQAMVRASLADDPQSPRHEAPAFRAPNGTFVDLFEAFSARPLYDPGAIRAPALLIRGGADPTSTRSDALQLFDRLGSEQKHYLEIANGAHFVSAERQAPSVFDATARFLLETALHP